MNSHNPFNTGSNGCSNDFCSADPLVDRIIGDAYHVVKEVYLALDNLTYIYNYLQKYGLIITVDSEEAIKDIPLSIGKFARVYNKSESVGYYFTDYLYVDDDTSGIKPNEPGATGSWVSTKATGSNASFVRIWKYRAETDGVTSIKLPTDVPIVGVQTIYVEGVRQDINEGFSYNEGTATITLADSLEVGNLVTVIIGVNDPDMDVDVFAILKNSDGASNIGTQSGETVQQVIDRNYANLREHWRRQLAEAGLNLVDGSFEYGAEVSTPTDAVWHIAEGQCYTWGGSLPKSVLVNSNPENSGGISEDGWNSVTSQSTLTVLAKSTGAQKSGYRYSDVYSVLSRFMAYQDHNIAQPALGRDESTNQTIWDAQSQLDLKHRGGIFAGKETYGIRENSTVASFRANTGTGSAFVPQVAGSDDLAVLAQAGALDSVAVFADTWLGEYNSWEDIATANYTATSFTVSDASLLAKVKVGQFLMTKHSSRYVGLVTGISGATVTVQKWVIYGTSTVGTPADGVGLYVNPVTKGWAFYGNVLIGPNSRAEKCALMELGLQNNGRADLALLTGADVVLLDGTYGGGDAYRGRGTSEIARWDNNFHAYAGTKTNFRSSNGSASSVCSIAAFYEESASAIGFLFAGKNTNRSMSFNNANGVEQTALAPHGFEVKGGKGLSTAVSGSVVTAGGKVVIQNSSAFALVLPDASNFTAGREIHFIVTGVSPITITSAQSGGTVNGNTSIIITPTYGYSEMTATYAGGGLWYVTR